MRAGTKDSPERLELSLSISRGGSARAVRASPCEVTVEVCLAVDAPDGFILDTRFFSKGEGFMKRCLFVAAMVAAALCCYQQIARAQGGEPEKSEATRYEVAAQFSSMTFSPDHTQPGAGARFTLNFNDNFALEAEMNYFPNDNGHLLHQPRQRSRDTRVVRHQGGQAFQELRHLCQSASRLYQFLRAASWILLRLLRQRRPAAFPLSSCARAA